MIDLADIERLDFTGADSRSKLDAVLGEVAGFAETRTAGEVVAILQRKLQQNPSLANVLTPFITKFQALALPLLRDEQVVALVKNVGTIIGDERISIYERLRARLLVLPPSRRQTLSQKTLAALRQSVEPLGTSPIRFREQQFPATVGSWVSVFERAGGLENPEALFSLSDFRNLPDDLDHAVRHLVHLIPLLAAPNTVEPKVAMRQPRPAASPVAPEPRAPANLPVEPEVAMTVPPLVRSRIPKVSAAASLSERGPTRAQVIARLRSAQEASAGPATVAHLTPEDEEEIANHSQRLAGYDVGPNVHDTLADTLQHIIKNNGLTFDDEHMERRFASVVTARLKDIRSSAETLDLLTRPPKIGGMGFDRQRAENIIAEASIEAAKFYDQSELQKLLAEQKRVAEPAPKPPKIPAPPPVSPAPVAPPPPPVPRVSPMTFAAPPSIRVPSAAAPVRTDQSQEPAAPTMPTAALRTTESERPRVADIRGMPRLTGPVEELRTMTPVDFRRLGPDPVACVRRVYDKIQRLGKESFTKKAEGIRAWRESDVYLLYVAMGQESLLSGKSIRDLTMARQQSGQPSLSEQEFMLIADLNRKLRF